MSTKKRKITIDWEAVHDAFVFRSEEIHAVLDLETGQVRYLHESGWDAEGSEELSSEEVEADPDRYVDIEPPESRDSFRWMERFAEDVENNRARGDLFRALDGKRPFRRFKDALADFPDLLEKWYAFEETCIIECMADWARSLDVAIANPPPWLTDDAKSEQQEKEAPVKLPQRSGRKLVWQDVCPLCRKYLESDRRPDDHPLTRKAGLTELDLCSLNRDDQENSGEDFQCGAFESVVKH